MTSKTQLYRVSYTVHTEISAETQLQALKMVMEAGEIFDSEKENWSVRLAHETKTEHRLCLHYWGDYRKRCQRPEGHAGEHWYLAPASAISVEVDFGTMPPEEPTPEV